MVEANFTLVSSSPNTERQRIHNYREQSTADRILHEECSVLPPAGYKLRYIKVRSATLRQSESKLETQNTIQPRDVTTEGNPQPHTEVALMLFVE